MDSKKQYNLTKIKKLAKFDDDLADKLKNLGFKKRHFSALKRFEIVGSVLK